MLKKMNKKGFTLAELLIVVAIIAVLVAISIPIFRSQLEKAREATDMANIRSAYAEASAAALENADWSTGSTDKPATNNIFTAYAYNEDAGTWTITVKATQKDIKNGPEDCGWANGMPNIGGINVQASTNSYEVAVKADGTCDITIK